MSDSQASETYLSRGDGADRWSAGGGLVSRDGASPRHVRRASASSGGSFGKGTKKVKRRTASVDSAWNYGTTPISSKVGMTCGVW